MRVLSYVFETTLAFSEPVSDHSFVLRCLPRSGSTQKAMESQVFTAPRVALSEQADGFGNRTVVGYCPQSHNTFDFYATGLVMAESEDLSPVSCHPMFSVPTHLTAADEALREEAFQAARDFGWEKASGPEDAARAEERARLVWSMALCLCERIHRRFAYCPGATDVTTPAAEAFRRAKGVCQDYTQVLVALCRTLGIPARYVTGLMVGEGATHAWAEVHDGIRWRGIDPTNNCAVNDGYLIFSYGRDFADCPIERGVFRGTAVQTQTVSAYLGEDAGVVNKATAHLSERQGVR